VGKIPAGSDEIQRGGGRVWIHNRSGNIQNHGLHSAYNMPNSSGWGPSQRLDFVNSHTSNNWGWSQQLSPWVPSGGGGYPGGGLGC
jgi:hypothetical protein